MNKFYRLFFCVLALSLVLTGGCAKDNPGNTDAVSDASSAEAHGESGSESAEARGESGSESAEPSAPSAPQLRFEGTDLEGNAVSSDVFSQSRLTMVNVWATYCSPCLNEMPALGELAADYDAGEFQIIGIVSDVLEGEDASTAEALVQETGADYTHLLLNESIYYGLLTDVSAVPTTFFLDKNGVVLDTVVGAMEKSDWEDKINGLLEGL